MSDVRAGFDLRRFGDIVAIFATRSTDISSFATEQHATAYYHQTSQGIQQRGSIHCCWVRDKSFSGESSCTSMTGRQGRMHASTPNKSSSISSSRGVTFQLLPGRADAYCFSIASAGTFTEHRKSGAQSAHCNGQGMPPQAVLGPGFDFQEELRRLLSWSEFIYITAFVTSHPRTSSFIGPSLRTMRLFIHLKITLLSKAHVCSYSEPGLLISRTPAPRTFPSCLPGTRAFLCWQNIPTKECYTGKQQDP